MRNAFINAEFYDFRVNEDEFDFIWCSMKENAQNDGVGADRFTGTGCTCNDHMRHFCHIADNGISGDVLSNSKCQLALGISKQITFQDFPQGNRIPVAVRNFNADSCPSGNWRFNSHAFGSKCQCNVVGKPCNFGDLYASGRLYLILCNSRAPVNTDNTHLYSKAFQRCKQCIRIFT